MLLSPSAVLLDSEELRNRFSDALTMLDQTNPRLAREAPLAYLCEYVYRLTSTADLSTFPADTATRLADSRALAKWICNAGIAYNATRNIAAYDTGDWLALLTYTRARAATIEHIDGFGPWARAVAYITDRCDQVLQANAEETERAGAHGVLRALASSLPFKGKFDPAWALHPHGFVA
ncbi:hypothetical protein [Streptomyces kronopolitis]|uniref:hypothetical protein n=1 Tax=Streptomyces kronopolitis TaxID=1612435 RepID=UPI0020C0171C|nr:hypothetical protein [Streptomyces kronopolitis]MCL6298705.1 hypothetical protein [Streptomyces kronopolitis]